jgi:hypothetical protein
MSAPVKRTMLAVAAAIVMAALSSFFAVTLARLMRQDEKENDAESAGLGSPVQTRARESAESANRLNLPHVLDSRIDR